jgi:hypothetical protein
MGRKKIYEDFVCRKCGTAGKENFYESTSKSTCKSCWKKRTYAYKKDINKELKLARGGACEKCGYDNTLLALQWHHRDPSQKDHKFTVQMARGRLEKEIEGCDLLCANCHVEAHIDMGTYEEL